MNVLHNAPRILLVEDDPRVQVFLERALAEDGYYVISAASGREVRLALRRENLDLIVLDLSLPDTDGLDLLREIRAGDPHIKVLAVSGFMVGDMPNIVVKAGASATLTKPASAMQLRYAVYALLDPSQAWVGQARR